jgi:hypothetical protein
MMILLVLVSLLYGAVAAFVFRRTTNPRRIRQTTNQILARIMEFRLFVDEPALIWRAQLGALRANFALLRQIAMPCLIMAALFAIIYPTLDRRFGHAPLTMGEPTVLTAHTDQTPHIDGIAIETPGVRIPRTGEVSWRIRPVNTIIGTLPTGVKIQYPRTTAWLVWFFAISSLSAFVIIAKL